MHPRDQWIN